MPSQSARLQPSEKDSACFAFRAKQVIDVRRKGVAETSRPSSTRPSKPGEPGARTLRGLPPSRPEPSEEMTSSTPTETGRGRGSTWRLHGDRQLLWPDIRVGAATAPSESGPRVRRLRRWPACQRAVSLGTHLCPSICPSPRVLPPPRNHGDCHPLSEHSRRRRRRTRRPTPRSCGPLCSSGPCPDRPRSPSRKLVMFDARGDVTSRAHPAVGPTDARVSAIAAYTPPCTRLVTCVICGLDGDDPFHRRVVQVVSSSRRTCRTARSWSCGVRRGSNAIRLRSPGRRIVGARQPAETPTYRPDRRTPIDDPGLGLSHRLTLDSSSRRSAPHSNCRM